MKLILASNNAHKAKEFREILAPLGIEVVTQSEAGCDFEADETGVTFEENAYIKAEAAMKATGLAAVSDDSGLEVDALGGEPGVHSARYTGRHEDSDADRRAFLMKKLEGVEHRSARFVSAICCAFPNGDVLRARELVKGRVLENSMLTAREACETLSARCRAEQVQVIGSKFVLYKRNEQKPVIELPKAAKNK